jgi:thiamine-monophosphate kinase
MPKIDENRLVRMIQEGFGTKSAGLIRGIGDDAAVLHPRGSREYWVVTTDMLLEGIDFQRTWITPQQLGHKSLAVNLSDLAAMGANPRFFTVALALPAEIRTGWIKAFYTGMTALARRNDVVLIGGDLSRSLAGIQVTITAIGESAGKRPVYRSGGRPGDFLYVTGTLGKAAAGLALLMSGRLRGRNTAERAALEAHCAPTPRCEVGLWLARNGFARCLMDLSDGLSVDLRRLCSASGAGAEIWGAQLPVFAEARRWGCDPVALAMHGGEDFELLLAVPARRAARFEKLYPRGFPPIRQIGCLLRETAIVWRPEPGAAPRPLIPAGFDHFRG